MSQDAQMVKDLKMGDVKAFNQLFEAYSHRLYTFGLKYLKSNTDAEELVQDVFLKIWRNREKLKEEKSFSAYLFTIAYNQIKEYFQYKGVFLNVAEEKQEIGAVDISTEDGISYRSVLEHIGKLLSQLPEKKQKIFHLSRFEGKSAKEIALQLGISPKTVDNQVSEVIGFLREQLRDSSFLVWLFFYLFLQ
ncbi:MAG: RNA polymerase sigma factor [Bacteroidota bacterium]